MIDLPSWAAMMNDPTLIVGVMYNLGFDNVTSISDIEPLSGGATAENTKAYINWTDGTQTKVQIKGNKVIEEGTTRYREALFNSRLKVTLSDYGINVIPHYVAVADVKPDLTIKGYEVDLRSSALEINYFMTGWMDMNEIYGAVADGTEDELDLPNFDWATT